MEKTTRILMMYQSLMKGNILNKTACSLEFEISERSFDRDIQEIRIFLSESFSGLELIYDEKRHGYRLKNLAQKQDIAIGECYILTKLLLDSRPLRTDDQNEIVQIMLSQLSASARRRVEPVISKTPEIPQCLKKASVKLIEDLLFSIERKDRIHLHFGSEYQNECCVPYSIEFRHRKTYLVAWLLELEKAVLFNLDDILSYCPTNYAYDLVEREKQELNELIAMVCDKSAEKYRPFVYERRHKHGSL